VSARGAAGLALAALFGACSREEPERAAPAPTFELRAVLAPRLAEFRAELAPPRAPDAIAPDAEVAQEELEAILGPLRAGDPDLRELALEDARRLSPQGLAALALQLGDPSEADPCRGGVAEALANDASPSSIEALLAEVERGGEPWLRAQCAYQLGRAGRDHVLPRLLLRLKYESDFGAAFWIADTVSRFGHLAGVEAMLVVWNATEDETLRAQAERRLQELASERGCGSAGELVQRWKDGTLAAAAVPFASSRALEAEAWRWIERLGDWSLRVVDDARFVLSRSEAWIVPLLAEALHESEVHVRIHAAQCLERMGARARGAVDELVAALGEPRSAPAAAAALGALGAAESAPALERCLAESPDPELQVAAATALGLVARPESRAALRRSFETAAAVDLRQATAQALTRLEDARDALSFLLECLTLPAADAGAAEMALEHWVQRRAQESATFAELHERWRALDPAPGTLPDEHALRTRREARAALVRAGLE
jgi:hypothetical protein